MMNCSVRRLAARFGLKASARSSLCVAPVGLEFQKTINYTLRLFSGNGEKVGAVEDRFAMSEEEKAAEFMQFKADPTQFLNNMSASLREEADQKYSHAEMHRERGEYDEALALFTEALELCKDLDGEESTNVATIYNNMALIYDSQGHHTKALELYEMSLEISLANLGAEHPEVASTYNNMALTYRNQGDYTKSLEYF